MSNPRLARQAIIGLLLAGSAALGTATPAGASVRAATSAPATTVRNLSTCQSASALVSVVDAATPGSTVTLPAGSCYDTPGPLIIQGVSDVTVDGNGAVLVRTQAGPLSLTDWKPQVELFQDSGLIIKDLTVRGPQSTGGVYGEPQSGVIVESCQDVTLSDVNIVDEAGDLVGLYPPGVHMTAKAGLYKGPNENIVFNGGQWSGAGFHAATVEAAIGATFTNLSISDINIDGFDFEWDGGVHNPQLPGPPQEQVTISHNTFDNVNDVVVNVNDTGATQVSNLAVEDNALTGHTWATFDIGVTGNDSLPIQGLTISGNTSQSAEEGPGMDGVDLAHIDGAMVSDNTFPYAWATQPAATANLSRTAVTASQSTSVDVEDNTFVGAVSPASGAAASCGNTYLVSAWQDQLTTQAPCS
jgi:hypothetical protein